MHGKESLIDVDGYAVSSFIFSIISFENFFVSIIIYVSYRSDFMKELLNGIHPVVGVAFISLLVFLQLAMYLLNGPDNLFIRMILKVPELIVSCILYSWLASEISFSFFAFWYSLFISSFISLFFVKNE